MMDAISDDTDEQIFIPNSLQSGYLNLLRPLFLADY